MSSQRSVLVSGLLAILVAAALIGATVGTGVLNSKSTSVTTSSLSQSNYSQTTTNSTGQPSGSLAVLMTDPPTVPTGVTQVYINYTNLAIHVGDAGNNTGWVKLNSSGSIDLMSIINVTQTIALANVTTGLFNGIAFNVSSALVTYGNTNYSAGLIYQNHLLVAWIPGGITIIQGQLAAAVIDLTPTILLLGTPSSPTFAFIPEARAYTIPAQSMSSASLYIGNRENVEGAQWWKNIETNAHFEITNLQLSPNLLSITVTNTGNYSLVFRMAAVTSTTSAQGGFRSLAAMMSISELFVVQPNASLTPITVYSKGQITDLVEAAGYLLPPHASVTFAYQGNITIGILQPLASSNNENGQGNGVLQPVQQIIPGQRYVVTIRTEGGLTAQTLILAS
ncbi:MAG: DUF4382 domain-containing protein [Nitrososphaerales archaeon]